MTFRIGDKVVYPAQGPCLIDAVVKKAIAGEPTSFYKLSLLDDSCDAVLVPVEKLGVLHVRHLVAKSEIPKLLGHLRNSPTTSKNWKQRAIDNAKLLASGSAFDLAEIVGSLTELNEAKALLPRDRQTLAKAKKFLICEISEATEESRNAAEGEIDRVLESKRTLLKSNTAYVQSFPSRRRYNEHARPGFTSQVR
jgi:RNA polymerase-interacting CarD/CdnL/TRCF family regulator